MKKWIASLLMSLYLTQAWCDSYLFVLYDAGETFALMPVIDELKSRGEEVAVLAFGTSQKIIKDARKIPEVDNEWNRYQKLKKETLDHLLSSYQPTSVVIGVASVIQLQVAEFFHDKAHITAYYDNFGPIDHIGYASLIRQIEEKVDLFLAASSFGANTSHAKKVRVVGNPDQKVTAEKLKQVDTSALKKQLGLNPKKRVITYIGGYEGEDAQALLILAEVLKDFPDDYLIVCPHPKKDGSLERKILKNGLFFEDTIYSFESVALADVVVCHRSTLGYKSLVAGKKVIFIDPVSSSLIVEWGDALVTNPEECERALRNSAPCAAPLPFENSVRLFCQFLTNEKSE